MMLSYAVIAVCVVMCILLNRSQFPVDAAVKYGALVPLRVKRREYWRLLTAGFLHIQIWHLLMKMQSMYNMSGLEYVFGVPLYALILFGSVIGGNLLSVFFAEDEAQVSLGLSGGLYGLLGAYFVLLFKMGALGSTSVQMSLLRMALVNLLINLMPNVSRMAHAGGFLTGFALAMFML